MSMESLLSREFLRVVEEAAIAAARTMGQGERKGSDRVAVEAMRKAMDSLPMRGTVVIGEGERDEAPMLFIGEQVFLKAGMMLKAELERKCPALCDTERGAG